MRRLLGLLVLAAIAGLAAVTFLWWSGGADKATTVTVREGATLTSLCPSLEKQGLIRGNCATYRFFAKVLGDSDGIQAGEFEVPAGTSGARLLDILQHGQPVQRLITIPEGMPSILVQEKLAANPNLTGPAPLPAEGAVLPDSYGFQKGESRAAVAGRMQAAMTKALAELWPKRKVGSCPVATPEQAVILASIVEKETGKPAERRAVAGVYCNRLKIGMKLDADPTVIYPVTKGKPLGRRILKSELDADTGYNTYRMAGLPAGPIANPGRASIAAVLDPEPNRYLYFVADGTGGHVFAETLAEHNANVKKWFAIRKARGEM
ncbi:endolytic transglycosylase MltG [Sphingomonas astaxanthinifaciens]|uniref:Endolytic murein transglycosylase n=1 Tax=Sphingomonas astaxanthinifaciens DSM 22298 TaxID=1123267 RepID=A0ABQ5Z8H8_9SPHN|nr:endolytic transglycosylase MltG [Sphingomonas astaxanthinifaciens]GLR48300.1 aminodeoxychorismate lyase [Sphingomonas astaxanthinifaciens DSM 22298]